MPDRFLVDTDVLIDYLRAQPSAAAWLENLAEAPLISSITVAELYAEVRDGVERTALDSFVAGCEVVPVDEIVAVRGGLYRRDYGKSHHVGLADALIAASATVRHATLVTLNAKHFPMLAEVLVPYQKV